MHGLLIQGQLLPEDCVNGIFYGVLTFSGLVALPTSIFISISIQQWLEKSKQKAVELGLPNRWHLVGCFLR